MVKIPLLYLGKMFFDVWEENSIVKLDDVAVDWIFFVVYFDFINQSLVFCRLEPVDLLKSSHYFIEFDGQAVGPEDKVDGT
jgi:hypothetical protein